MRLIGFVLTLPLLVAARVAHFVVWDLLWPSPPREPPGRSRRVSPYFDEAVYLRRRIQEMAIRHHQERERLEAQLRQEHQRRERQLDRRSSG